MFSHKILFKYVILPLMIAKINIYEKNICALTPYLRVGSWRLDLDFPENRPEDNHGEEEAPPSPSWGRDQ